MRATDTAETRDLLSATLDALIVDVNRDTLGDIDAIRDQTCRGIDPHLPILVLTSHTAELHRTRRLERGADDVLCKPFSYPELRARLGALLRRADARRTPQVLRAGSLRLDLRSRRAWVGEVEIEPLRGKEYQLLLALIAEPERVFTREELFRSVWGLGSYARTRTLDSHVISSTVSGVGCVGCGFRPAPRRRFISSGVDSALAAELSPEGEATWRGRCAPFDHPSSRSIQLWLPLILPIGSRCPMGERRGRCSALMAARSLRCRGSCGICIGSSARRTRCVRRL